MANFPGHDPGYGGFGYRGAGGAPPPPPQRQRSSHWLAWVGIIGGLVGAYLTAPATTAGGRLRWMGGRLLGMIALFYALIFGLKLLVTGGEVVALGVNALPGQWWTAGIMAGVVALGLALYHDWLRLLVTTHRGRIILVTIVIGTLWTLCDRIQSGLGVKVALLVLIFYKARRWGSGGTFP